MSYQEAGPSTSSTTTTTQRPAAGGGGRPPVAYSEEEIFLDGKCGLEDTRKLFLESCINPTSQGVKGIKCNGLRGSSGTCDLDLRYTFANAGSSRQTGVGDPDDDSVYSPDPTTAGSSTTTAQTPTTTTIASVPSKPTRIPTGFDYEYNCGFGPGKLQTLRGNVVVPRDKMESVVKFCRQELYGVSEIPLWLILLIIFLVIAAVSITAALFWKYWLRKKLYGKDQGDKSIGSIYTSTPFSSNNSSALTSSGAPRSTTKKISRRSSASVGGPGSVGSVGGISKQAALSSTRTSNYGPYKLLSSHKADSVTGKAPSVRSAISRSLSDRTLKGRPPSTN